jgi:hypothetical protein
MGTNVIPNNKRTREFQFLHPPRLFAGKAVHIRRKLLQVFSSAALPFDAKYTLTSKNSPPILTVESGILLNKSNKKVEGACRRRITGKRHSQEE